MSRFVSAGAINAETGEAVANEADKTAGTTTTTTTQTPAAESKKTAEWELVQKELDAERRRREEARIKAVEGGEKSLYDVLQANKAAKQAAFEEQNRIKNQFRALDDDEIEFLDEVRQSARAEEERVRRETEEGLAAFRRAQQKRPGPVDDDEKNADGGNEAGGDAAGEEDWAVGPRKRRKGREAARFGVRRERSDGEKKTEGEPAAAAAAAGEKKDGEGKEAVKEVEKKPAPAPAPAKPEMGLVAYGSDSDDD